MSHKFKKFLESFSLVMLAQIYSMFISAITIFVMPKYFSNEAYAYYQLENLYCGYIWIFSLGVDIGFFLKYGGDKRSELNRSAISTQIMLYVMYIVFISALLIAINSFTEHDLNKKFVFSVSVIIVALEIIINILGRLMQAINAAKQYFSIIFLVRTLSVFLLIVGIVLEVRNFKFLIMQDLISKVVTVGFSLFLLKDILFGNIQHFDDAFKELRSMIYMGINIMFSSYASKLINSIIQYMIESIWGLIIFGKIALCFSISTLFTKLASVAGTVIFPILRRIDTEKQEQIYNVLSLLIPVSMLISFCFYTPAVFALKKFLPLYADSLDFLVIVLPMCLFEAKISVLVNIYLQIVHKEKEVLRSNIISVFLSLLFSVMIAVGFKSLFIAIVSVDIVMAIRCWYAEKRLHLYLKNIKNSNWDLWVMSGIFVFCNWNVKGLYGMLIYTLIVILYISVMKKKLTKAVKYAYYIISGK